LAFSTWHLVMTGRLELPRLLLGYSPPSTPRAPRKIFTTETQRHRERRVELRPHLGSVQNAENFYLFSSEAVDDEVGQIG